VTNARSLVQACARACADQLFRALRAASGGVWWPYRTSARTTMTKIIGRSTRAVKTHATTGAVQGSWPRSL
jgi:hypothetical protein